MQELQIVLWCATVGGFLRASTMAVDAAPILCGRIRRRRAAVRLAVLVIASAMILDTLPYSWKWLAGPKQYLSRVLNPLGLWQGEWPLFAPDPVINNGWLTAELQSTDGTLEQWDSPLWSQASGWEKFAGFRHVDYYNHVPLPANYPARDDLLDYLIRRAAKPVKTAKLYRNQLRMQLPEDGSLPPRDEIPWMFSSEIILRRTFQP
jgi:hypothetical protein